MALLPEGEKSGDIRAGIRMIITWTQNIQDQRVIGRLLVDLGKVTPSQVEEAVQYQKANGCRIGEAMIALGFVDEKDLLEVMAGTFHMTPIKSLDMKVLEEIGFDNRLFQNLDPNVLDGMGVLPVRVEIETTPEQSVQVWTLYVIVDDPWRLSEVEQVKSEVVDILRKEGLGGFGAVAGDSQFLEGDDFEVEVIGYLARRKDISSVISELSAHQGALSLGVTFDEEHLASKQISDIMKTAISRKATDIHITPMHSRGGLLVRIRVDGDLVTVIRDGKVSAKEYNMLMNKIMLMAGMDNTQKRQPQDGNISWVHERTFYDLRVASIPTSLSTMDLDGNKIQIRILSKNAGGLSLEDLGLMGDSLSIVREMYSQPSGILLSAGPTGSGKTTTIYSILKNLDLESQSCYSIEDPVEYHLEGATQIPVSEREGVTFAKILRTLLRLDPDIVFLGEIRDAESALIATQISNTGHSVFSTVHTNSAYLTPLRLSSMGVPDYMLVGNLNGVIAQRLVKKNCPYCTAPYTPSERVIRALGLPRDIVFSAGTGKTPSGGVCPHCGGRGTLGRIGIFEIMPLFREDGWEELIRHPKKLREFMRSKGYPDIMDDAIAKMRDGYISPDSLLGILSRPEAVIEEGLRQ